ncbi:PIG-L deacetylase family protein [Conexibacter sp. CPCC 206217]|uniref:PIG-L deacetylase family protein n=1 Tax=Conexibacter sp. CPCC 206217 TaxID=3064574 RepID=UPI002721F035|nr:PIG-L family deacetylase [Conexibacter sp. CPCC 206217]MDO8209843.1 PIG-L family deacetylase [Conexibacter sp. CPCC 206217]
MRPRRMFVRAPRIVVVSPHLDDAALSMGATISRAARAGAHVTALTVFAGDPDSVADAGPWDRACGFGSARDAARVRREEDVRACAILGATPAWLAFADVEYEPEHDADAIWAALAPCLAGAQLVLTPGFPLHHPDHEWLTRLLVARLPADAPLAFYVEQPYANTAAIGRGYDRASLGKVARIGVRSAAGRRLQAPQPSDTIGQIAATPLEWIAAGADAEARDAKRRAILAYGSQLDGLGGRLTERIRLYEWGWGGEGVGLKQAGAAADTVET